MRIPKVLSKLVSNRYVRYGAAGLAAVAVGAITAIATHGGDSSQGLLAPQAGQSLSRQIFRAIKVNNEERPAGARQQSDTGKPAASSNKPAASDAKVKSASTAAAPAAATAPAASPNPSPVAAVPAKFSITGQNSYTLRAGDRLDGTLATSDASSVHWQTAAGSFVWSDNASNQTDEDSVAIYLSFPRDAFDGSKISYSVFASPLAKPGSYENSLHITDVSRGIDLAYTIRTTIVE